MRAAGPWGYLIMSFPGAIDIKEPSWTESERAKSYSGHLQNLDLERFLNMCSTFFWENAAHCWWPFHTVKRKQKRQSCFMGPRNIQARWTVNHKSQENQPMPKSSSQENAFHRERWKDHHCLRNEMEMWLEMSHLGCTSMIPMINHPHWIAYSYIWLSLHYVEAI